MTFQNKSDDLIIVQIIAEEINSFDVSFIFMSDCHIKHDTTAFLHTHPKFSTITTILVQCAVKQSTCYQITTRRSRLNL